MINKRVRFRDRWLTLPDDETLERFKEAFPDMSNAELSAITNNGVIYNCKLGKYLGLKKGPVFYEKRKKISLAARRISGKHSGNPKGFNPPWLRKWQYGQPNGNKRITRERLSEAMTALWKQEKLRAKYGLQRQTKLRVRA